MAKNAADQTCSVCLEQFIEPKILPCCHTFCLKCLERTVTEQKEEEGREEENKEVASPCPPSPPPLPPLSLSPPPPPPPPPPPLPPSALVGMMEKETMKVACPLCRKTHAIPPGGLQDFLTDFIVTHEVEILGLKSSSAENAPACGECEGEGSIESFCRDCQSYLCTECTTQAHKKYKPYRGHKVIPVQDLDAAFLQSSKVYYCSTHSSEVLKLYCETCGKLICRDCTLVDHRQHTYKFAQDARKQINDKLTSLEKNAKVRLAEFKTNMGEIQKVEATAANYSKVLRADINTLFDTLVQSIEKRRQQLLTQAEAECQKDLKQIWADKNFHETTISQIDAALALASKAHKCTSDVEMILTALQSVKQLSQLKKLKWDAKAFATVISSPGIVTEGTKVKVKKAGNIERASFDDVIVQNLPTTAELGQTITFKVIRALLDGRSKHKVNLLCTAETTENCAKIVVKYGHAQKSHEGVSISKNPQLDGGCMVTLRLVCGGKHTIEVKYDKKPIKGSPFSLNVSGRPDVGTRVRKGPDWKNRGWGNIQEGRVQSIQTNPRGYKFQPVGCDQGASTVTVYWNNGFPCNHTWGGPYEIELV